MVKPSRKLPCGTEQKSRCLRAVAAGTLQSLTVQAELSFSIFFYSDLFSTILGGLGSRDLGFRVKVLGIKVPLGFLRFWVQAFHGFSFEA